MLKITAGTLVGLFAILTLMQDTFSLNFGMDNMLFNSLGAALSMRVRAIVILKNSPDAIHP